MTLPTSGAISMNMLAVELGASNAGLSLNDSRVRALTNIAAPGRITFQNLRGRRADKFQVAAGSTIHYVSGSPTTITGFCAGFDNTFEDGAIEVISFGSRSPTLIFGGYVVHGIYTDPSGLVLELAFSGTQSAPLQNLFRGVGLKSQGQPQSRVTAYNVVELRNGTTVSRYRYNLISEKFVAGDTDTFAVYS